MREREAQGLDGLMAKMTGIWEKETADWLACVSYCSLTAGTFCSPLLSSLSLSLSSSFLVYHSPALPFLSFPFSLSHTLIRIHFSLINLTLPRSSLTLFLTFLPCFLCFLFSFTSCLQPSQWPCVTPGRSITLEWNSGSVAPYSTLSARIIHLWSIPFCGEPSSYSH